MKEQNLRAEIGSEIWICGWARRSAAFRYCHGMIGTAGIAEQYICRLSAEEIERVRAAAAAVGLPFCEKPYQEDFDPYIYDGSMSLHNYALMHRMIRRGGK